MRYQGEISGDQREISERSGGDQPEISGDQREISVKSERYNARVSIKENLRDHGEIRERSVRNQWRSARDQGEISRDQWRSGRDQ